MTFRLANISSIICQNRNRDTVSTIIIIINNGGHAFIPDTLKVHNKIFIYRLQTQRLKLWSVNSNEVITTVFPTGDWNKVIIESDFIDEMAFNVFKLYYGDKLVLDVVGREGCGVSWFDIKDLSNTKVRYTIFIDRFFRRVFYPKFFK